MAGFALAAAAAAAARCFLVLDPVSLPPPTVVAVDCHASVTGGGVERRHVERSLPADAAVPTPAPSSSLSL